MHEPNVQRLLQIVQPGWKILDIGGWACPFNRATHVMDAEPYATRGYYAKIGGRGFQGGEKEYFSEATWIRRDICGREPYPFQDKELDFVVCSHTLEDIRDPLWVCSEMVRIARRGYLEIPSRLWETCLGAEHPVLAGLSHHRWLIEIKGNHVAFLPKYHMIHRGPRYNLPPSLLRSLTPEESITYLFWDGSFTFEERSIHGVDAMGEEMRRFVDQYASRVGPRRLARAWGDTAESLSLFGQKVSRAIRRLTGK